MNGLSTAIQAVTVYPDRARITRHGKAALEASVQQLVIEELPLQMSRESLRVSAHGTARARLMGVQVQRKHYVEAPSEAIRQLEGQIEALEDELWQLDNQVVLIKQQRETLNNIAAQADKFALALASGEMKVEQELAIFDGLRTQAEKLDHEAQGLKGKRKLLEQRLQKLNKDLEQMRSIRPRTRYAAVVEVEVLQPGELTFEVSYLVGQAQWMPVYDLRLVEEAGSSKCEVTYQAQVTQNTGESWDGVSMTLSTARPALSLSLPELQPWYVHPPERPYHAMISETAMAPAPAMRAKAVHAVARMDAAEEATLSQEADVALAAVDSSGASVTYILPGMVSIPPDGTAHKVTVARFMLQPKMDYLSAPRLSEVVFRRAKINNDSPYTLLRGMASLFVGDEFIGSSLIELTAPQGEIELALGVEDRIKVKRELKRREVDKRLIGGRRHQVYGYEIRIENLLPVKANLKLHDQFPVAQHEDIKVKLEVCDPKPGEQTELNVLKWEFSLETAEKRVVRFDFSVDSPQGMEVAGLP